MSSGSVGYTAGVIQGGSMNILINSVVPEPVTSVLVCQRPKPVCDMKQEKKSNSKFSHLLRPIVCLKLGVLYVSIKFRKW